LQADGFVELLFDSKDPLISTECLVKMILYHSFVSSLSISVFTIKPRIPSHYYAESITNFLYFMKIFAVEVPVSPVALETIDLFLITIYWS